MDLNIFEPYIKDGYIRKVISPCEKMVTYNYTDKTTFNKKWDEITINARGTIYEISSGEVIAKSFCKFYNFSELDDETKTKYLNQENFDVYEKMDGSLGIVYFYDGKWRVNTRGSFTSDQAVKATEMLEKYDMDSIPTNITLLAEIIYPENRIIVNYGDEEKLTLLAMYNLDMKKEVPQNLLTKYSPFPVAEKYTFKSVKDIITKQSELSKMEEGFVVRFSDGYRIKFKSVEYIKIAKIISNMTPLQFWRNMENGKVNSEILEEIPEELREESDNIKNSLEREYTKVLDEIKKDFLFIKRKLGTLSPDIEEDRKTLGLYLKQDDLQLKYSGAMFSVFLDGDVDKYIMKQIKPQGNQL